MVVTVSMLTLTTSLNKWVQVLFLLMPSPEDQLNDLEQYTQEIRLASDTNEALEWQVGAFYFDSSFGVTSVDGYYGATTVYHGNESWAVFGQSTYNLTHRWDITGGVRYTYDEKTFWVGQQNVDGFALVTGDASIQNYDPLKVDDGQVSWELSSNYRLTDTTSVFGRVASGFPCSVDSRS